MSYSADHWTSIAQELLFDGVADNVFRPTPVLDWFWNYKTVQDGGSLIDWRFNITENEQGQTYTPYSDFLVKPLDFVKRASIEWIDYVFPIVLSKNEMAKARTSVDKINMLQETINNVERSMRKTIETDIFGDGSPRVHPVFGVEAGVQTPMDGLEKIVAADRSYAGFDSTTYTALDAYVIANAAASFDELITPDDADFIGRDANEVITETGDGDDNCDAIFTTTILKDAFTSAPMMNLSSALGGTIGVRSDSKKGVVSYGDDGAMFRERFIAHSRQCTTDRIYFLNSNHIQLVVLKEANMKFEGFEGTSRSDSLVANFKLSCNIKCDEPRRQGKITFTAGNITR